MSDICPRTGQPCSVPKQFKVTEITQAGIRVIDCCQNCIMNQPGMTAIPVQGVLPVLPNPVQGIKNLMQKLHGQNPQGQNPPQIVQQKTQACPFCGSNPVSIESSGRFGCSSCYETFKEDIESMLMRHHGAIRHVGKVPKAWKARQEAGEPKESTVDRAVATIKRHKAVPLIERLKMLEEKMAACVKIEDYERAATIRDVIKSLRESATESVATSDDPPFQAE
jgi:protein arginine kinase activator